MTAIDVNNMPIDVALRRFKRDCENAEILKRLREKQYRVSKSEQRKINRAAAKKRNKKRLQKEQRSREKSRSVFFQERSDSS